MPPRPLLPRASSKTLGPAPGHLQHRQPAPGPRQTRLLACPNAALARPPHPPHSARRQEGRRRAACLRAPLLQPLASVSPALPAGARCRMRVPSSLLGACPTCASPATACPARLPRASRRVRMARRTENACIDPLRTRGHNNQGQLSVTCAPEEAGPARQ